MIKHIKISKNSEKAKIYLLTYYLKSWLNYMKREINKPNGSYAKIRSLRLDKEVYNKLREIKWDSNMSYNGVIEMLINLYYERKT